MWPDRVSNPGPLTYESAALPTALLGPAERRGVCERKDTGLKRWNICAVVAIYFH